ncbi:peptidoglycan DD-metalloendopeptidase family protein, partial [Staphylococcus succinus]|uniref:peptidoglycan DD-metalloendopeptidase family protein n=1 Tax=Staphylococcus succinus TaxID=61015 RepID=UPI00301C8B5D
MYAPKGRNVTVPLGKGDIVHNGKSVQKAQKAGLLPKFASGTGKDIGKELLKKKKKKNHEHAMDGLGSFGPTGGGFKDAVADLTGKLVGSGVSTSKKAAKKVGDVGQGAKEAVKTAGSWIKEKGLDLLEFVGNPKKLLDKVLGAFGVKFPKVKGEIPKDMMWDPMWKGLKNGTKSLFDGWLTEAEGAGDGGYIDLSRGINFGFGSPPGYPFGRHDGLDINYPYGSKLYSTLTGTAVGKSGYNGGFGRHMNIKADNGLTAIYGHMSKLAFDKKRVKPGSYLGRSGGDPARQGANAGMSTGPHLHYEMRKKNGQPFDPTNWLKTNNGGGGTKKSASRWAGDIKRAARNTGVKLSNGELKGIIAQIQRESNGDAGVTQGNIGDINNINGTPAQGLLQYVPSTFKAYATKGHKNIKNGYHQLRAFFNNSNWRRDLPYGRSGWGPTGRNRGYATGGIINSSGMYNLAEDGHSEVVVPLDPSRANDAMKLIAYAQSKVGADKRNKRPNQMRNQTSTDNSSNDNNLMMRMVAELQEQNKYLKELVGINKNIEQQPKGFTERDVSQAQGDRSRRMNYYAGGSAF